MLFQLLANAVYLGKTVHHGESHDGEHAPIIALDLWDAVQQQIEANRVARTTGSNAAHSSLLVGTIRDGHGRRMTPSHPARGNKRYRYYITHGSELRDGDPPALRLPARDIERVVVARLQQLLRDRSELHRLVAVDLDGQVLVEVIRAAATLAEELDDSSKRRGIVGVLVRQVEAQEQFIRVGLDAAALRRRVGIAAASDTPDPWLETATVKVWNNRGAKLVISDSGGHDAARDEQLVELLLCRHRLSRLVRLSWLAPEIVIAIFGGRHPASLTPRRLLAADPPLCWSQQKAMFGLA